MKHPGSAVVLLCIVAASGCVPPDAYAPPQQGTVYTPPQTEVFFYPAQGQSPARQDRDRYECYLWAVRQSGFDPSQVILAPTQRIVVQPTTPPGAGVAAGAVAGAIIGAALGAPHDEAEGAIVGAIAGGAMGAPRRLNWRQSLSRSGGPPDPPPRLPHWGSFRPMLDMN